MLIFCSEVTGVSCAYIFNCTGFSQHSTAYCKRWVTLYLPTKRTEFYEYSSNAMEFHRTELDKHCRVCGRRLFGAKLKYRTVTYTCVQFANELQLAFGLDISKDDHLIFPASFCSNCKRAITQILTSRSSGKPYRSFIKVHQWEAHNESCKVYTGACMHVNNAIYNLCTFRYASILSHVEEGAIQKKLKKAKHYKHPQTLHLQC